MPTNLHVPHVLHDILQILLTGEPRELVSDDLPLVPGMDLGSFPRADARPAWLIRLDKEGAVRPGRSREGHGVEGEGGYEKDLLGTRGEGGGYNETRVARWRNNE